MRPELVTSPADRLDASTLEILFSTGDGGYAIAAMMYKGRHTTRHEPRVGIRWNGPSDQDKGHPVNSGHPVWFILPHEIGEAVAAFVKAFQKS